MDSSHESRVAKSHDPQNFAATLLSRSNRVSSAGVNSPIVITRHDTSDEALVQASG